MGLFPRGKLEILSQAGKLFVYSEAGFHGRDFEQDSARLSEIDRCEVAPVAYLGYLQASSSDFFAQLELLVRIRNRECDVMDGAEAIRGCGSIGSDDDIN